MKRRRWLAITGAAALLATAPAAVAQAQAQAQVLTLSAASSLGDAFKEAAQAFSAVRPGVQVRLNLAASGVLVQQLQHGAPVDVLASADEDSFQRGVAQGLLVAGSRRDIASNSLVLVVPASAGTAPGAAVRGVADLTHIAVQRVAIGKPATVPAGRYAQQTLQAAGLWQQLQPKLVLADNVRQVLDYVARGEAQAGYVYLSDVAVPASTGAGTGELAKAAQRGVRIVQTAHGHAPIRLLAAAATGSRHPELAADFIAFITGAQGQAILRRHGFAPPAAP